MNRALLSILCFVMFSFVAKADEMVVTFGPNNKYAGDITNKVAFETTGDLENGQAFNLPGFGSFDVTLKEGSTQDKINNISAGGSGGNPHMAIYKDYILGFKFNQGITVTKMEFNCATAKYTVALTPSVGTCDVNSSAKTITWEGSITSALNFEVGGAARYTWIIINYTKEGSTGIDEVSADNNAPVEYYNLQGVRVNNPENGVYIMRQGADVQKVYVK